MIKGLVTVVLPVYNVERYLERCLHSVVSQTYDKLEILLVDDGSTDNSPRICDEWADKDRRIRVAHQANAGLGIARNTGIREIHGEYVCFFDSDDYIAPNAIADAYAMACAEAADVVLFGFTYEDGVGNKGKSVIPRSVKPLYQGDEIRSVLLPRLITQRAEGEPVNNLWMSAWACMYSAQLISQRQWRFISEREIISEDVYSLLHLYAYVGRVAVLPEALYFYCENSASLTRTYRSDRYEKIKYFYDHCVEAASSLGFDRPVVEALGYPYIANVIAAMKMIVIAPLTVLEKQTALRTILEDGHLTKVLRTMNIRQEPLPRRALLTAMQWRSARLCQTLIGLKARGNDVRTRKTIHTGRAV
jgi:glycosyltransferase involved in cell wall biosynthesis